MPRDPIIGTTIDQNHPEQGRCAASLERDGDVIPVTILSKPPSPTTEQLASGVGHLVVGPAPRFTDLVKWCTVADVPDQELPKVPTYECRWTENPPLIDGRLSGPAWENAPWSEPFGDIRSGDRTGYETRVALLWDSEYLYVGFRVQDPDIRAQTVKPNEHVYVQDDDAEIFIDFGDGYYEIGVNPVNCTYQIQWTWLDPVVQAQDWARLEELFKLPDYLYYTRRSTESLGRVGNRDFSLPGLRHAVAIEGSINNPASADVGWTVEMAIPWRSLSEMSNETSLPPKAGSSMRMQAYRAQHDWSTEQENFLGGGSEFQGYTWSAMGNTNVHNPERWTVVNFHQ